MSPIRNVSRLIDDWLAHDLDQWTKHVVRRHFDPVTGSQYWLDRATKLAFDPRDVTRYEQLSAFGPFPLGELRVLDPADMVPQALPRPLSGKVWETGGTTGTPCRVFYSQPMIEHRCAWRRWAIEREGFEPGRNWLQATPTGPHIIGYGGTDLAELYNARVYGIDFDPRWVKRLLRAGKLRDATEYTSHAIEQITAILSTQPIDYLVTTPAVLQALARREPGLVAGLRGAWLSGTHITAEMWRNSVKALDGGPLSVQYGNTLGNALPLTVQHDGALIPYMPNYPQITMTVVDKTDWTQVVDYGEYGQVRLTVMHDDLFMPNILERDIALRHDPGTEWPCDGVANVGPLQDTRAAPEGLY